MDKQKEQPYFWKSLDEKYQSSKFQALAEQEFQSSPLREDDEKGGLARRQFMKLMGASIALSTAACVRRPVQTIIPYNKRPFEIEPGIANYYASAIFDGRESFGVTIKTREGRPLHIEGNPDFPVNGQGLSVRASALILSLYDPDRIKTPVINSQNPKKRGNKLSIPRDWESLDKKVAEQIKKGGLRILSQGSATPTANTLLNKFVSQFGGKVVHWNALNYGDISQAQKLCYGKATVPQNRYDKSKMTVSVDGDFLGTFLNPVESSKLFNEARKPEGEMARLISFQSVNSLTSINADDNYPIKASQQLPVVLGMIHELLFVQNKSSFASNSSIRSLTSPHEKIYLSLNMSHDEFAAIVSGLWENKGKSLVVAGGPQTRTKDSLGLQVAVNFLNSILENDGKTIYHQKSLSGYGGSDDQLKNLLAEIKAGEVKTLVIDGVNPAYNLPNAKEFRDALAKVEMVISTANWMDETAVMADIVAPSGHQLENWDERKFSNGVTAIQQPTISPLYKTRSFADSLMVWSKMAGNAVSSSETFFDHLKKTWIGKLGSEARWFQFLQDGFFGEANASTESSRSFNTSALSQATPTMEEGELELVLYSKVAIGDGSMTNTSWLHELPDPVSKIAWDNYLCMSPKTGKAQGLKEGDMVKVTSPEAVIELPVYFSPGMHPQSVAVALGYGRRKGGELQEGVGFDVYPMVHWDKDHMIYSGHPIALQKTGKCYELAQTQGHFNMQGRSLAVETSHKSFKRGDDIPIHRHKMFSIWGGHKYEGHKWAMGVDLNSCTGCSACMISCQSENNVPVVGKKYILQGREMHWIRIDRYYSGDENSKVDGIFQPVMCQHCENAPCESVCPVLATVHSDEGLNDMSYNRCVGTRYCANNCPYKVRRFNWFYYGNENNKKPLNMAFNPDVTVRTRGVMEKCSFCVQRIKDAKNVAKDEGRSLKDGDIKTACQAVCPTGAIVFGDLNDTSSQVSQWFASSRNYPLLEEVNAEPRVRYLAKIRNTDRDLGGGHHGDSHEAKGHGDDHSDDSTHKEGH